MVGYEDILEQKLLAPAKVATSDNSPTDVKQQPGKQSTIAVEAVGGAELPASRTDHVHRSMPPAKVSA